METFYSLETGRLGRGWNGFAEVKRWCWRIFSKHIGTLVMPSVCLERCIWHKSQ